MSNKGLLIVISGPSGAGKGTIFNKVLEQLPTMKKSVSVTTRKPRPGEIEGVHYYFRTEEEYNRMIACGEFLETASVYNNYYGTPKEPIMEMLENGDDVLFEIDNHGSRQIKLHYEDAITIYVMTPTFEDLRNRLEQRGTESADSMKTRLGNARHELSEYKNFDYIIFNDDVDVATEEVISIICAEKRKMCRNVDTIKKLLNSK